MRFDEQTKLNPLAENYYPNLLSDLVGYMQLVEAEVIGIICDRLKKVGELNPTSAKQISVLSKDYGADMQAIKKTIRKRMKLSTEEVDRIFEQAAKDSTDLATALAMDRNNVVDLRKVAQQARAVAARYKNELLNLPDTFAFKMGEKYRPLREAYIAVTNKATLAVHSGALDYNTAIRQEVKRLAENGISVVQWESGYHRRLDSSVRMNVMEGVRQMNQEILNEAGEKFATGYEISAHDRPAPDHADIQGRQYTKEDYEKLNASLKRPIGTLNCMHIAFPIVYGVTKPTYSNKELEEMKEHAEEKYYWKGKELNGYECTQMQRRYETEIRKSQDKERALRRAGDTVGADLEKKNTQALRKEYKAFSEHVGLSEKLNRTGRAGSPVSKSKVQRKSAANNPVIEDDKKGKIEYNQVEKLKEPLSEQEIINKVGGGDMTQGSCTSAALAYAGNRAGYDVRDFRGGLSCDTFSGNGVIKRIAVSTDGALIKSENDFDAAKQLLKKVVPGKEYILSVGKHTAVVRKATDRGYEFLELQDPLINGFKKLTTERLQNRFKCKKTHVKYGIKIQETSELIDLDKLASWDGFSDLLGYINTVESKQMKGAFGHVK